MALVAASSPVAFAQVPAPAISGADCDRQLRDLYRDLSRQDVVGADQALASATTLRQALETLATIPAGIEAAGSLAYDPDLRVALNRSRAGALVHGWAAFSRLQEAEHVIVSPEKRKAILRERDAAAALLIQCYNDLRLELAAGRPEGVAVEPLREILTTPASVAGFSYQSAWKPGEHPQGISHNICKRPVKSIFNLGAGCVNMLSF
jgi:hypothetical protein